MYRLRSVVVILIMAMLAFSQDSFYSFYGFGTDSPSIPARMIGIGKAGIAVSDSFSLNTLNPACWVNFPTTSLQGQVVSFFLNVPEIPFKNYSSRFTGFSFKFPIKKRIGVAFGLMPKSRMNVAKTFIDSTNFGTSYIQYESTIEALGGISSFYLGSGFQINSQTSVGILTQLLIGNYIYRSNTDLDRDRRFYFEKMNEIQGSQIGFGILWSDDSKSLNLAAYSEWNLYLKVRTHLNYTFGPDSISGFRSLSYPNCIRIGISKKLPFKLSVNADLGYSKVNRTLFKEFYIFEQISSRDSYFAGIGLERVPEHKAQLSFLQQLYLRAGVYYQTAPFYKSDILSDAGITFGLGFPFNKFRSRLDLALVFSKRNGFLQQASEERLISFHIEITSGELWFTKIRRR